MSIICVLQLKFEKSAAIFLKNALPFSLPGQCNVENEVKLQVLVFLSSPPLTPFLFLLSPHAFARLPLGSRFLPLRGNGKDCYAGYTVCGAGAGVKLGKCSYIRVWRVLASAQERKQGKEKKTFVYDFSQVVLPGVTFSEHTIVVCWSGKEDISPVRFARSPGSITQLLDIQCSCYKTIILYFGANV